MKRALIITVIIVVAGFFVLAGYKGYKAPSQSDANKVKVAASFYPLYFFASEIGGDKAEVRNITPAGAEPHDYEPTAQDIAYIQSSQLLVLNGLLEPWGESIRQNVIKKTVIITAGDGLFAPAASASEIDPHIWLDPKLAERMADNILFGFKEADPENAAFYEANAAALKQKLISLDADFKSGLAGCGKNAFVTAHAAFSYLAVDYGLVQNSIAGLSPDAEPSPAELAAVALFARENKVKYIFFESLVSPKLAQTIAAEIGAQTMVLNPLEGLTDENVKAGENYFSVMRQNLANLKIALECAK